MRAGDACSRTRAVRVSRRGRARPKRRNRHRAEKGSAPYHRDRTPCEPKLFRRCSERHWAGRWFIAGPNVAAAVRYAAPSTNLPRFLAGIEQRAQPSSACAHPTRVLRATFGGAMAYRRPQCRPPYEQLQTAVSAVRASARVSSCTRRQRSAQPRVPCACRPRSAARARPRVPAPSDPTRTKSGELR